MIDNIIDTDTVSKHLGNISNEFRSFRPLPRTAELFAELTTFLLVSYIVGTILFMVTTVKFILFIPNILRNTPKRHISRTVLLCGMYTIVAASSLTSILVPRAQIFCESVSVVTFALCFYQFFCLMLDYAGGESNFIRIADDVKVFDLRKPPCCCLCFINPMHIDKDKFMKNRMLILQLPIVQGIIYFMLNIIYLEDSLLYNDISLYIMPFMGVSLLCGIWGMQVSSRMFSPLFLEYKIMPKYFAVQLVLLICKLQPLIAQIEFMINGSHTDGYPITRKVISNVIVNLLILIEVVFLSLWSHYLYKVPSQNGGKAKDEMEST